MALIKSISGIRGTIGGQAGDNLTPQDIVECTAAFGAWLLETGKTPRVVLGRDARISGAMVKALVSNTLISLGIDVLDVDLSTTPTVEMAVVWEKAGAGIIITASHNPKEWNALKFLNEKGEFISKADGEYLLAKIEEGSIQYAEVDQIGTITPLSGTMEQHIQAILDYPLVDVAAIRSAQFKVVLDAINSTGGIAVPMLLDQLGCETIVINGEINGQFAHNPEPLAKHLTELSAAIIKEQAHLGISVDPDVDRLAFVNEDGTMFGEEFTLVAVADYILGQRGGNSVSNLSSTRALRDITERHGGQYFASAVGEVNVVTTMKNENAAIGGEGNGGIIVPDFHYGRDALIGIALFLSHLSKKKMKMSALKATYPSYDMVKDKIALHAGIDLNKILIALEKKYQKENYNTIDGLKIDFPTAWVHLRKSNTEPIIRVYAEASTQEKAQALVAQLKQDVEDLLSEK